MSQVLFEDGQFHRDDKLIVGANSRGLRYGDGLFETMKVINGRLQLGNWHMERLFAGLRLLQFEPPAHFNADYLTDNILKLVHRNGHSRLARVRLMIFRANGALYDTVSNYPHHVIQSWPLQDAQHEWNESGWEIGFHRTARKAMDPLANAKTNNYLPYVMAAMDAKKHKWNDAVLLNAAGRIADATIANIFLVKQGTVYTPPASDGPVLGVMRRYLIQFCRNKGVSLEEKPLSEIELMDADEIFLTNTSYGIRWVARSGGKHFANTLSRRLYEEAIRPLFQS